MQLCTHLQRVQQLQLALGEQGAARARVVPHETQPLQISQQSLTPIAHIQAALQGVQQILMLSFV